MGSRSTSPRGRSRSLALLFAVTGILSLAGQPCVATGLTLDELMRESLVRNRDLAGARAQIDAARARLQQAGLRPNPRFEVSDDQTLGNSGEYTRSIGVTQDFSIKSRLARAQDVARVDVTRAFAELNEAERGLLGEIASAYYELVAIDQSFELRERLIQIDETLVQVSTDRQKAGEVSEIDVNTAVLELERLRQAQVVSTGDRAAAVKTLAGLAGYAPGETPEIDTTLAGIVPPPPLAQLTDQALAQRPDLRLLGLAADRARAEQALAQASAWEDWSVSLGVQRDKLVIDDGPAQSADNVLALSLSVPYPLFNRNQGSIAAAVADARTAEEQVAALRLRIENEVAGRHEQVSRLLTALRAYREHTLPLSRRNTDLTHTAYREGQLSIADVVQAERQENDVNAGYADTLALYLRALAELNTAVVAHAPLMTNALEDAAASGAR